MTRSVPTASVMQEYLLTYGQEWVESEYNISPTKIDQLLYGGVVPTKEVLNKRKKDVERGMDWWKYYRDIEKLIDESGDEFWETSPSTIEYIALRYSSKSGVPIKTELVDHFIWDDKYKSQIKRENRSYHNEISNNKADDVMKDWVKMYPKIIERVSRKDKLTISSATSKTKEDIIHDTFLSNCSTGQVKNNEITNLNIRKCFKKSVIKGKFESFVER